MKKAYRKGAVGALMDEYERAAYLDLPIREALRSSDPLVRAFAIVDRRVGRRILEKLEISDSEHTLVKAFYALRVASPHT